MRIEPAVIVISSAPGIDLQPAAVVARHVARTIVVSSERGYGAALAAAFCEVKEASCTHAIVLDVGRGHNLRYLRDFIAAMHVDPEAIIVGIRHYQQSRPSVGQRFGRWNCDFWTWAETGRWIHDTTYGFKAYPLNPIANLAVRSEQTDREVEMLAKAVWAGIHIVQIPLPTEASAETLVPLGAGEIARFGATTMRLTCERFLLPAPLRATIHQRPFADLPLGHRLQVICREAILHHCDPPSRFAACMGLGVFFGIVPIWGFQMLAAAAMAHLLGLSKQLVLAASYISSPLTIPLILYASLVLGHLMFHGQLSGLPRPHEIQPSILLPYLREYIVGSIVLAGAAGLTATVVGFFAARAVKVLRRSTPA